MDKLIYTAFNTLNNIYDNRSVRAQNMANVNVPGYRRDLGTKSVGSAFMSAENTFQARALAIRLRQDPMRRVAHDVHRAAGFHRQRAPEHVHRRILHKL